MNDPLFALIVIAVGLVLLILVSGLGTFGKGGDFNKNNANKIMRWRIIAQGIAVALIVIYVWARGGTGG